MVTVDDATYVKMKDTLYGGDAGAASKAKAKIESSYTDEQYNKFISGLGSIPQSTGVSSNTQSNTVSNNTPINNTVTQTPIKQQETSISTDTEIKQSGAMKPLSQEYYNQTSDKALEVIKNNLNNYKQSNPEYFTNYEDYKKNFSYDSRNQEQKDVLDNFYNEYQKGLTLSSTPVNDLYTQYKDGQISLGDLELLKSNNPTKYAELQNQINKASILTAYDDTTPTEKMNFQDIAYQMIASSLNMMKSGDYGASQYFSQLEEKMNSPEMLELQDKTTELDEQYKNIEDQIASIGKDVEEEYEGTGATKSKINAIIADRTYDLQQQLRTLGNEYEKYATQYNNRAQQYQNEFQLQLQEYQVNMQARNQKMNELGFAMYLMNFETNEQKAQREWDYRVKQQEYTNGNINSKDYDTRYKAALKSVQNLLSQYEGIPMQRSAEQMAQDILKAIDGGSDLGAELTKINKQIQGKPEYKYLYNQTYNPASASGMDLKTFNLGGEDYIVYNGELMSASDFNSKYGGVGGVNVKPYDIVDESAFSIAALDPSYKNLGGFLLDPKNANKKYGGECATFVNNYLEKIGVGRYYGTEDVKTREQRCNSDTPKVGTIAVFDYGIVNKKTGKNYGHVAIVTKVNDDGSFVVKESNFNSDGIIGTRTVKPNSPSLKGFFDPSKGARSVSENVNTEVSNSNGVSTKTTITDSDIISFNDKTLNRKLSDEDRQRIADARNKVYSDPNASIEDILRFSQGGDSVTDTTVQSFDKYGQALTSLGQLTDLLEDTSTGPILGALRSKNPYDKKAREIETAIAGLLPTLARGVYGEVGVLTDKDIEHYSKTVPNLKSTNDVNEAVLAMSLDMLASGYKRKLQNQAALGKDVSGMAGVYYQIVNESNRIKQKIGIDTNTTANATTTSTPVSGLNLVKNQIENWDTNNNSFLQKYANTAPSNNKIYMVDGYQVQR